MGNFGPLAAANLKELCKREWLLTDHHGYFAMGTASGMRTRKYHSLLSGIAGRSERNFLAHMDLTCFDRDLSTHAYKSPTDSDAVYHPRGYEALNSFQDQPWPQWKWTLPQGEVTAQLRAVASGGFEYEISFNNENNLSDGIPSEIIAPFTLRPLWAMRPLHGMNSHPVELLADGQTYVFRARHEALQVSITADRPVLWQESPSLEESWFRHFYYEEEEKRGFQCTEDLFSAGHFRFTLPTSGSIRIRFKAGSAALPSDVAGTENRFPIFDFILKNPAGVVAGFPWFGEWGRDTFISLPGIFAADLDKNNLQSEKITDSGIPWTVEVLDRWGQWIESQGMLPNVITAEGPQWESSDATLWWCHALASIWTMARAHKHLFSFAENLRNRFAPRLQLAIAAIKQQRHLHLKYINSGLLEVTTDHSTWMDARVDGVAATPRVGLLPEINALWIQAQCLQSLWNQSEGTDWFKAAMELLALELERERPNIVFLHSLPLAPSFLFRCFRGELPPAFLEDVLHLRNQFWTPVGLRTLAPYAESYTPLYDGPPQKRDLIYHKGAAWGWLKGHFDMAAQRVPPEIFYETENTVSSVQRSTVAGHYAELFDGEAPFTPRGIPAQAWSIACAEEARLRKQWSVDQSTSHLLKEHQP